MSLGQSQASHVFLRLVYQQQDCESSPFLAPCLSDEVLAAALVAPLVDEREFEAELRGAAVAAARGLPGMDERASAEDVSQ